MFFCLNFSIFCKNLYFFNGKIYKIFFSKKYRKILEQVQVSLRPVFLQKTAWHHMRCTDSRKHKFILKKAVEFAIFKTLFMGFFKITRNDGVRTILTQLRKPL